MLITRAGEHHMVHVMEFVQLEYKVHFARPFLSCLNPGFLVLPSENPRVFFHPPPGTMVWHPKLEYICLPHRKIKDPSECMVVIPQLQAVGSIGPDRREGLRASLVIYGDSIPGISISNVCWGHPGIGVPFSVVLLEK